MTLRLNNVDHTVTYDGETKFDLNYHTAAGQEVDVIVHRSINDGTSSEVRQETTPTLEALHERAEEHAREFVAEHGTAFGEVDR